MKITEAAGVAQGTFYLYFASKKEVFDELVLDLNRRVRHAMTEAAVEGRDPRRGRSCSASAPSSASPPSTRRSTGSSARPSSSRPRCSATTTTASTSGYVAGLEQAMEAARSAQVDPEVLAWALMGIGELLGMRWILWNGEHEHARRRLRRARADHRARARSREVTLEP